MMSLENILPVEEQRIGGSSKAGKMSSFLSPLRQSAREMVILCIIEVNFRGIGSENS
jgi:hypothetical protein